MSRPALLDKLFQAGKWLLKPGLVPVDDVTIKRNQTAVYVALDALIRQGGGLAVGSDKRIYVDFSLMPTDAFEELLKSIRVPIWLTGHKNFYVNGEVGSDTLDEGRGASAGKPFKTIQACVDYVCENYNIGPYNLIINVSAGIYVENVVIPEIARTTGGLYLWGHSETDTVIETGNNTLRQVATVKIEGFCNVDIRRFTIKALDSKLDSSFENIYLDALNVARYAQVSMSQCVMEGYQTAASDELDLNRVRVVSAEGGLALSAPIAIKGSYTASINANKISGIVAYDGSNVAIQGYTDANAFEMSGSFVYTVHAPGGYINRNVNSNPVVTGDAMGKRYYCANGGKISTNGGGEEYFPGSEAGTVEESSYSWYK